jgi:protein-ribulosamine 3-kinase
MISGTMPIPNDIQNVLHEKLGSILSFTPASGGCINHGGKIVTSARHFFLKWNDSQKYPGMFRAEAQGLQLLAAQKCVHVPSVVMHDAISKYQFIVMDFVLQLPPAKTFWEDLGFGLATLHRVTSNTFGLDHDNYIGSLPQINSAKESWSLFFIQQRLVPQLNLLHPDVGIRRKFDSLFAKIDNIFPKEQPALMHGDLWSGNLIRDQHGLPCLIDPAVYFGHREMELAFTKLFGGFDSRFYDAYKEVFPLVPGYEEREDVCNLYPLLVHANLFGGHYLLEIEDILRRRA